MQEATAADTSADKLGHLPRAGRARVAKRTSEVNDDKGDERSARHTPQACSPTGDSVSQWDLEKKLKQGKRQTGAPACAAAHVLSTLLHRLAVACLNVTGEDLPHLDSWLLFHVASTTKAGSWKINLAW